MDDLKQAVDEIVSWDCVCDGKGVEDEEPCSACRVRAAILSLAQRIQREAVQEGLRKAMEVINPDDELCWEMTARQCSDLGYPPEDWCPPCRLRRAIRATPPTEGKAE